MIFFGDAVQFFAFIVLNISGKSHRAWWSIIFARLEWSRGQGLVDSWFIFIPKRILLVF